MNPIAFDLQTCLPMGYNQSQIRQARAYADKHRIDIFEAFNILSHTKEEITFVNNKPVEQKTKYIPLINEKFIHKEYKFVKI